MTQTPEQIAASLTTAQVRALRFPRRASARSRMALFRWESRNDTWLMDEFGLEATPLGQAVLAALDKGAAT